MAGGHEIVNRLLDLAICLYSTASGVVWRPRDAIHVGSCDDMAAQKSVENKLHFHVNLEDPRILYSDRTPFTSVSPYCHSLLTSHYFLSWASELEHTSIPQRLIIPLTTI